MLHHVLPNELPSGVNVPLVDGLFNETSDDGAIVLHGVLVVLPPHSLGAVSGCARASCQTIFRLLLQDFGRMIGSMAKDHHHRAANQQ